jgi:hypothetical protein
MASSTMPYNVTELCAKADDIEAAKKTAPVALEMTTFFIGDPQ